MELPGSVRVPLPEARALGRPRPDERVQVTLLLRRRADLAPFPSPSGASPILTREAFAATHGAHPSDLETVRTFARRAGLELLAESIGPRTVLLSGPLSALEQSFGVTLQRWTYPGGSYRGRLGPIQIPGELASVVVGVFGLDNRPQARSHFRRRTGARATDLTYSPPTVAAAYDFPVGTDGTGQTVGILELGGGYSTSDLAAYFSGLHVAPPLVVAVPVDGASNSPTGDPNGPDGEVALDIEVVGSVAPAARIAVYFAPNTDQGFLDGLGQAVHDTTYRPSVISVSWGGPEHSWTAQALSALNAVCEDAATMGITVVVASGDGGAADGGTAGSRDVDFPASSPYALGCGGTRLVLAGSAIVSEVTWNELAQGEGATGGGVSESFPRPAYQTTASVPDAPNGFAGRGVPDVAGDADPTTGYAVRIDGESAVLGGTSAVAPLWGALIARINQALGTPVGFLNPRLYSPVPSGALHDITVGNNGGYSAGPGWDACTGLGSPDGAKLLAALRGGSGRG
ncbi:MAG TPA: S53 family peptidase [Thermoplasmata archaeon]|nr:S53 family peptidase [Thermoplasmata archaeon]